MGGTIQPTNQAAEQPINRLIYLCDDGRGAGLEERRPPLAHRLEPACPCVVSHGAEQGGEHGQGAGCMERQG